MKGLKVRFKVVDRENQNNVVGYDIKTRAEAEKIQQEMQQAKVGAGNFTQHRANWRYKVEMIY